jgi:hypothetical protein
MGRCLFLARLAVVAFSVAAPPQSQSFMNQFLSSINVPFRQKENVTLDAPFLFDLSRFEAKSLWFQVEALYMNITSCK